MKELFVIFLDFRNIRNIDDHCDKIQRNKQKQVYDKLHRVTENDDRDMVFWQTSEMLF